MPANKKHLTSSGFQRLLKITSGVLGGYAVTTIFHMALAVFLSKTIVLSTFTYTGFILWATMMIIAFLPKSGWKSWGINITVALIFTAIYLFGKYMDSVV